MPKFSLITVCKNAAPALQRTLYSAKQQTFADYEHIVIDGGSTDNTFKVLAEYKDYIDKVISEPDTGVYNAMNKGIRLAGGGYLLFLNAGDIFLHENVLHMVAEQLTRKTVDVFFGHTLSLDRVTGKAFIRTQLPYVNRLTLWGSTIAHQAAFINRRAFAEIGLYEESFQILADYEWFCRAIIIHNCSCQYYDFVPVVYGLDGLSSAPANSDIAKRAWQERRIIRQKYYNKLGLLVYQNDFFYWKFLRLNVFIYKVWKKLRRKEK
ncbi:glycosyl transferase GTA-type super family [Candidatus Termititenax aidoneus]|uniref:Glycosyl transferase GTA-type super family n=1 Tax=Termititenax aidoneus TaxID=2218524 RepID=A0A388TCX1_TERA1|nr:glycosyl transferase GTA-type super family [Candidatus Termititenax aidoneus]